MSLVNINNRSYYYKTERVNGKVRCRYIASGEDALLWAELDALDRREHRAHLRALRRIRERTLAPERRVQAALAEFFTLTDPLANALMAAAGYHRHDRGHWRKRRTMKATKTAKAKTKRTKAKALPVIPAANPQGTPAQRAKIERQGQAAVNELIDRATAGDKAALERLLGYLDTLPRLTVMDPGEWAAQRIAGASAGPKDLLSPALGLRKFRTLRDELAPPGGTVLERLLASRVALCYLAVNKYEEIEAEPAHIDAAHRRFLSAARTLHLVRQAPLRPVQVNVSQNVQVATAAIVSAPSPALIGGSDATTTTGGQLPAPSLDREV